jgi:hypothetical protein
VRVASTGGVMQQPSSHYYLAIYGGTVDAGTSDERFLARIAYFERPEFRDAGFADKDMGWFAMAGTKIKGAGETAGPYGRGLYAFFGVGEMAGYVRADADAVAPDTPRERDYRLAGLTAALEYDLKLAGVVVGFGHQTFVGYVDRTQAEAFVAWPFNTFQMRLGYAW